MKKCFQYLILFPLMVCVLSFFASCGSSGGGGGDAPGEPKPASLSLGLSQITINSDNSDSAVVTATVLDKSNAVISGVTVKFNSSGGQLSSPSVDTDENGGASVTFKSGTADRSNQIVSVTATVAGLDSRQVPVQVIGTTIELFTDTADIEVGGNDTAVLTITLEDAGEIAIFDAPVTITAKPEGVASLSQYMGNTDVTGDLDVYVTGRGAGDVTVTVESMGAIATQAYTVGVVGSVFGISSPAQDSVSLPTNTDLTIKIETPDQSVVQISATFGTLTGTLGTGQVIREPVSGASTTVTFGSDVVGLATIQVSDVDNPSITDSLQVAVSAPSREASQLSLQSSASVVALSLGPLSNSVTLEATVKNRSGQVVGGAPVVFSIIGATGGGETISPVIVYTDSSGVATSALTSGSLSTDGDGLIVTANVVGMPAVQDSINLIIGGTAGSVVLGYATESDDTDTTYTLPMSVMVSDSNGNPVAGAVVALGIWPSRYAKSGWCEDCILATCFFKNEDVNKNLILDPGEDVNRDKKLTPPNSAAGTVPEMVTTDENGVANFELYYLKKYALWIEAEIRASTMVLGTETQSICKFWLPGDPYPLAPSPFN